MEYPKFKVCVRCFTFNQSKYITDAMNGFCMQQTDYPFVCCIVDDASIDDEQDVINQYLADNFNLKDTSVAFTRETEYAKIRYAQHNENKNCYFAVLLLKENHYGKKTKLPYLSEWREICEYEALCEGDDYWIDKNKLQKQVEFLDRNPLKCMCYGKARCYIDYNKSYGSIIGKNVTSIKDRLLSSSVPTLTSLYRISKYEEFAIQKENWVHEPWLMGDYPLWIWMHINGGCCFLDDILGVYRITKSSASHGSYEFRKKFIENAREIALFFIKQFKLSIDTIDIKNAYSIQIFYTCLQYNNSSNLYAAYKDIKQKTMRIRLKYLCSKIPLIREISSRFSKRNM